jgi:hypothetical protein
MTKALRGDRPPRRVPQPGERVPVSFRTDQDLKGALDQGSADLGVSLMSYCESILRRGVDFEAAFGGPRAAAFFRSLASLVTAYGFGEDWLDGGPRFDIVLNFLVSHLRAMRRIPPSEFRPGDELQMQFYSLINTRRLPEARVLIEGADLSPERRDAFLAEVAEVERRDAWLAEIEARRAADSPAADDPPGEPPDRND